ncbi:MAG: MarC family NAAT transporter [Puniceicoccales bacterium]|jgi:multiple antibiotic resistance protein|nr:MarC family NAAT transporter [Puniceicoccales bacterium]
MSPALALAPPLGFSLTFDFDSAWSLFLGTILGILPVINPLGGATTFLAITEGDSDVEKRAQARRAAFYCVGILTAFLLFGSLIMKVFSISIPGIRIAGGIIVARVGFGMLASKSRTDADSEEHRAAVAKPDISFTPLAMPMLAGPGSIGVTLGFASLARGWQDYAAIIAGFVVVVLVTWVTLLAAVRAGKLVSAVGLRAMTQIMGLLLACMGIQFCVTGITEILREPAFIEAIRAVWRA